MKRWHEAEHLPFDTFVSPNGLHMNDWSYSCLAKWLGTAIDDAVNRPIATAQRPVQWKILGGAVDAVDAAPNYTTILALSGPCSRAGL